MKLEIKLDYEMKEKERLAEEMKSSFESNMANKGKMALAYANLEFDFEQAKKTIIKK